MKQTQRFAVDRIYCTPSQDRQFSFHLRRVNKPAYPYKGQFTVFNAQKQLPDQTSYFHVFSIGSIPPKLLNMLYQQRGWFKDQWIKCSTDMAERDMIIRIYNEEGVVLPSELAYYSFIDQNSLMVALQVPAGASRVFPMETFKYMHVYTNSYFQSVAFQSNPVRVGIDYKYQVVHNNTEKLQLQNYVSACRAQGGDVFIHVDGYYTDEISLNIPDGSHVEVVYDQSIKAVEYYPISELRTFDSTLDNRMKYLVYRTARAPYIDYNDDTEVFIQQSTGLVKKGLHFYKHRDYVMRNVTDKDFSLTSSYINNTAQALSTIVTGSLTDKRIVLYVRHSANPMTVAYSSLKLHELYKLPDSVQKDVICNSNYSLDIFRAEALENSHYFRVASASKISEVTPDLAASAVGYNGISYYYADNLISDSVNMNLQVAELYQGQSVAYEYTADGLYSGHYVTYGELYTKSSSDIGYVELLSGYIPTHMPPLLDNTMTHTLLQPDEDYVVISAYYDGVNKLSSWDDISATTYVSRTGNVLSFNLPVGQKARVLYLKQHNAYDTTIDLDSGVMEFNLTEQIDKGTGVMTYPCEVPPQSLTVFFNKRRLTHGIDYHIDFPKVVITSKKYIDYTQAEQSLHIRMSGHTLDKTKINEMEVKGFVNNGALTRNRYYDLRDDRVYTVFVDGRIKARDSVRYSETDHTVRLTDPSNGQPYTVSEQLIPVKLLTGVSTYELYTTNKLKDKKISEFFNAIFPEPSVNEFNAIPTAHYMYSPVVSRLLVDILTGVISSSTYMTPYDDNTVLQLIDARYSKDMKVDPVRMGFQDVLVEIHPHLGNSVINLSLHQYRFVQNVIRVLTAGKPEKINLSGYLSVSA